MTDPSHLATEDFLTIVDRTPLVSIDLLVTDSSGRLLLGKRLNRPAAGFWFVPGGRIKKGETIEEALARISETELGDRLALTDVSLVGAFTHLYEDDNFAGAKGVSTHYVVLAYRVAAERLQAAHLPDAQHSAYRWLAAGDDLTGVHENSRVYLEHLSTP